MPDVWVFDTSAIIDVRRDVPEHPPGLRRELLDEMARMVEEGSLCFPRQVFNELTSHSEDDFLARWAREVHSRVRYHYAPPESIVREVLTRQPLLADPRKTGVDADPYIVAQALAIRRDGMSVTVVTRDRVDRLPHTVSIATACDDRHIAIPHVILPVFCDAIGFELFRDPPQSL